MFPRASPRPTPLPAHEALYNFVSTSIRGPFLAAILFRFFVLKHILEPSAKMLTNKLGSERLAFGALLPLVHSAVYTSTFVLFETIEYLKLFEYYKIGRTPGQEPTWEMKRRAFLETAQGWPGMFFLGQLLYYFTQKRGSPTLLSKAPNITETTTHLFYGLFCVQVTFYFFHRGLHSKYLYERIHKKHHEFVGVRSVAAQSLHPIESIIQTIPVIVSIIIFKTHPILWLHYLGWRIYGGMEGHSGYCFRGSFLHSIGLTHSDEAAFHDFHHLESFKGNFGALWLDWLFGTMDGWIQVGKEEGYLEKCREQELAAKARAANFC